MKPIFAGVLIALTVTLGACSAGLSTASKASDDGCDADDFATGNVLFFGLADNLGPGTIMKRYAGQGVTPQYLVDSIASGQASAVVHRGRDWTCALGDSVFRAFDLNRAVGILPVDASLNARLAGASHLGVTVESVRWDDLLAGPYRAVVDNLGDARLKADLLGSRYLVVSRALAVKGIKITAVFDRSVGADLKAALGEGPKALKEGKVTATVNLSWESTTKLVITTPSEIYIAGQFRMFGYGTSPAADGTLDAAPSRGQMLVRTGG
jgi:hypothetical protein